MQKAIYLLLKTVWYPAPYFPEPLHCPIDGIILNAAGLPGSESMPDAIETFKGGFQQLGPFALTQGPRSLDQGELTAWPTTECRSGATRKGATPALRDASFSI